MKSAFNYGTVNSNVIVCILLLQLFFIFYNYAVLLCLLLRTNLNFFIHEFPKVTLTCCVNNKNIAIFSEFTAL